jgi:hypothetical protein
MAPPQLGSAAIPLKKMTLKACRDTWTLLVDMATSAGPDIGPEAGGGLLKRP